MRISKVFMRHSVLFVTCLGVLALTPAASFTTPAQDEETTRKLWDTAYIDAPKKPAASGHRAARRRYRVVTPDIAPAGVSADAVLGVTIWRLRPSKPADSGERLIVHESGSGAIEWAPERVSSETRFSEGDRLRLSFEAARAGFLYVIDREQYADGALGEPYLIFPTTRTRGGNNAVNIGTVIEVPAQDDSPPYFTLRRSKANQVGESLTVLVSAAPIEDLEIKEKAQKVPEEKLTAWERLWGGRTGRLEMEGGEGKPWTGAEKAAGAGARSLSVSEPAPQTVYYHPGEKSMVPVLISVQLHYGRSSPQVRTRRH